MNRIYYAPHEGNPIELVRHIGRHRDNVERWAIPGGKVATTEQLLECGTILGVVQ